ncbi:hypothetical protein [Endozoicomonas atrinae]|uniref:hypothetical protein n=1 Tax=Endozoicomonas atrinae TaxID=1333660 RepID=UPI000824AECF|nr:hypothetical protein [Endozoicomonas atrinae]
MSNHKLTNPKLNALRANVNPHTLAYFDSMFEQQQSVIDELINTNRTLHEQINECRLHIDSINAYLDNNAEYSLTKAKLARLIKKLELE